MATPVFYSAGSDVGRDRQQNEDSRAEYALGDGGILLVVADGMGGHEHGELASRIAVDALGQIFQNSPAPDPREKLKSGFLVANQRILTEIEKLGVEGMGTTAVAAYVKNGEVFVGHVGDSRLYQIRGGKIVWKTIDHTRVQRMVEMGILSPEDAKTHPDANVVSRALGFKSPEGGTVEPEVKDDPLVMTQGDSLVLCSDGLYDGVTDAEVADSVGGRTAEQAVKYLIDLANERGGHDNITVSVLHFGVEKGVKAGPASVASINRRRVTASDDRGDGKLPPSQRPKAGAPVATTAAAAAADDEEGGRKKTAAILIVIGVVLVGGAIAYWKLVMNKKKAEPEANTPDAAVMGAATDAAVVAAPDDAGAVTVAKDGAVSSPLYVPPPVRPPPVKKPKGDGGVPAAAGGGADGGAAKTGASKSDGGVGASHGTVTTKKADGGVPKPQPQPVPKPQPQPVPKPIKRDGGTT